MTTQLAIGYLAAGRRNPPGHGASPTSAHVTEHDSISGRPAIPQAVITWTDTEAQGSSLPVGARDPAAAIDGPASFRKVKVSDQRVKRVARFSADAVMFSVLVAMLFGLAGAVAKVGEQPNTAWAPRNPAALAAVGAGKVGHVEVSIERFVPAAAPVATQPSTETKHASSAKPAATN
jgi:hypothetical protein